MIFMSVPLPTSLTLFLFLLLFSAITQATIEPTVTANKKSHVLDSAAKPQPKLVLGLGLGGQYIHDYRGSKSTSLEILPFPFIRYSSGFLKVDRNGARGSIIDAKGFELNISADVALNGDDEDNILRQGMPELDTVLQFGPSIDVNVTGQNLDQGLSLRMPLRAAFAVSLEGVEAIGYNFAPKLTYRFTPYHKWQLKTDIGVLYASQRFHAYYYSVMPEFTTLSRPAFEAKSGYSGAFTKVSAVKLSDTWLWGMSIRYDNISGAAFTDSPLVETNNHIVISFGVAKMLYAR